MDSHNRLESWVDGALSRSPAQPLFLWRADHRLTVLAYHGVDDPARFEQHLDYLTRVMHPVTVDEVSDAIHGRRGLPKRATLVTFDDGDRSLVDIALPLLRARRAPAVAFVIAGLIDTNQAPWWIDVEHFIRHGAVTPHVSGRTPRDIVRALKEMPNDQRLLALADLRRTAAMAPPAVPQLRRADLLGLEAAGVSIGNHTLTHPCLNRCLDETIESELSLAHQRLAALTGTPPRSFAYPNGNADSRVERTLWRLGYDVGFIFDHQVSQWPPANRFRVSRVRVNASTPLSRFKILISGLHPAIHSMRGGL
jgi:peptidoglycan/xylan/chitin deacetylase (PgdA/CDA1 family)